jgi:2-(1,2-epoxy-1,2-dihydrophenyl)acetyl-CoA isomerase
LTAATDVLATTLAAGPTKAFGTVKRLFATSVNSSLEAQLTRESDGISAAGATADGKEGIAAFVAKRPPAFTGA